MRDTQHKLELWLLWSIGLSLIGAALLVIWMGRDGEAPGLVIGGFMTALPIVLNSIRGVRQSQAMQMMAEQLGQSTPALPPVEIPAPTFADPQPEN